MKKKFIIIALLALVALTGLAQTKTATIKGYSPALKDGTVAESSIDNVRVAPWRVSQRVTYSLREKDAPII